MRHDTRESRLSEICNEAIDAHREYENAEKKKNALLKFGWREAGINVARWFSAVNALKTKQKNTLE